MSAYSAEVFRSGIESIPNGQFEAAHALGLTFLQTLLQGHPSAGGARRHPRPTTSNCVSMFKDTSLASTVALPSFSRKPTTRRRSTPTPRR